MAIETQPGSSGKDGPNTADSSEKWAYATKPDSLESIRGHGGYLKLSQ